MGSLNHLAYAAGPSAAIYLRTQAADGTIASASSKIKGVIVLRAYDASLGDAWNEDEYRLIRAGGTRKRLAEQVAQPAAAQPDYIVQQAMRDLDALACDRQVFTNTACNGGRTVLLYWVGNFITSGNINTTQTINAVSYNINGANVFAVGNGINVNPQASDTTLVTEPANARATYTTATISGTNVDIGTFFGTSFANFTYSEAGLFSVAGTPPGAANAGTMYAHATYVYAKTSSVSLTNDYFIYFN